MLFCILLGLVWLMQDKRSGLSTPPVRLLPLEMDSVARLTITQSLFEVQCDKSGNDWTIVKPVKARAAAGAVDRILQTLSTMQRIETITPGQRQRRGLTLDDYGVGGKPAVKLTLSNTRTNVTLLLGRNALDDIIYVRFENDDTVLTTTVGILAVLPQSINDLRDHGLIHGDSSGATRLEIMIPSVGFIQATRKDGVWTMQQPVKGARLNNDKIARLLKTLYGAQTKQFVNSTDLTNVGLNDAQAAIRIGVWAGDESTGQRFFLGRDVPGRNDEVYARTDDPGEIFTVSRELLDTFSVKASDLRESSVFQMLPTDVMFISFHDGEGKLEFHRSGADWMISEPRRMKADPSIMNELLTKLCSMQVEEFIETDTPLPGSGLNPSPKSIELSTMLPQASEEPSSAKPVSGLSKILLVGSETPDHRYVQTRIENESSILHLGAEPLRSILKGLYTSLPSPRSSSTNEAARMVEGIWINPLLYCNRTMLEFERESIQGISLLKAGREQTVRKDEAGVWQPAPPLTGKVRDDVVRDMLAIAGHLEATEIRCHGSEDPASYGLDEPAAKIGFALADGKGIRKTLFIGFRAGSDGVYAMIQGQDVVFVLPMKLVGKLLRDLVPEEDHGG